MKYSMPSITFSLILLNITVCAGGGVTSSGGDSVAAEFSVTARHIASILENEIKTVVSSQDFLSAVNSTQVVSQDKVLLEGYERDAVNYPSLKKIVVGRNRWFETANQIGRRYILVMHEYLNIMGIDDSKYQISSKLFLANGKKRIEIVCDPFNDLTVYLKEQYRLHYILYEDREVILVKTIKGDLPTAPLGQAMGTGVLLPNKKSALLFLVNFGVIRNIQVPYNVIKPVTGIIKAKAWDSQVNGKKAPVRNVYCDAHKW